MEQTTTAEQRTSLPPSLYSSAPGAPEADPAGTIDVGPQTHLFAVGMLRSSAPPASLMEEAIHEHLPMVRFHALRIRERLPQQVEMEDLISAGVVGLIDAIEKFDPRKKVQFRTYAQFRVRGAMLDSLRALDWGPRDLRRKGRAIEEAIRILQARLGKDPCDQDVAEELGLDLPAYQQLLGELSGLELGSLNATPGEDMGVETIALIPAGPDDDPFLQCQTSEMRSRLAEAIAALPERERMVLTFYYYEELTMREVGLTMGIVESRVSQLHSSAVARLRVALRASNRKKAGRA